jgi:polyisoprenoid-binding protein YceI
MKRLTIIGGVLAVIAIGIIIWLVLRPSEEASAPIEAIPLEIEATEPPAEPTEPPPTDTAVPTPEPTAEVVVEEPTETPTAEPTPTLEPTEEPTAEPALQIFEISPEDSEVRFEIDEDLAGVHNTVVGRTDQVEAQLAVDYADLSTVQMGVLQINVRTLVTDNSFRNRALNNQILDTAAYEFITFTPTAINGLPDSVNIGDTIMFTIVGDLTIRDVTTEVTFDVEATAVSETQISGSASTIVTREAYGLVIPSVPQVANVEDEVELYIDFVANAVEEG